MSTKQQSKQLRISLRQERFPGRPHTRASLPTDSRSSWREEVSGGTAIMIARRSGDQAFSSLRQAVWLRGRVGGAQEEGCPDINIICERLTVGGLPTRFEDQTRLPMGVSVNSTSFSAKLLQVPARQHRTASLPLLSSHQTHLSS